MDDPGMSVPDEFSLDVPIENFLNTSKRRERERTFAESSETQSHFELGRLRLLLIA